MMHKKKLALLALLVVSLTGCIVTQADKVTNWQNQRAGTLLEGNQDPFVASVGSDVRKNSETLAEGPIGFPADREQEYHPDVSEAARNQSKQDHETLGLWADLAKKGAENLPWGAAVIGFLTTGAALFQKYAADRANYALMKGTSDVIDGLKSKDKNLAAIAADTMKTAAIAHGQYKKIREDIKKLRAKDMLPDNTSDLPSATEYLNTGNGAAVPGVPPVIPGTLI